MDDQNNNNVEEMDALQAMQKARKQAQRCQTKESTKLQDKSAKKGAAILHVNNFRSGIPEAKCKMANNPKFPSALKAGYIVRSRDVPNSEPYVVEAKLAARVYMVRDQKTSKFCALKIEPYYNEGDVKQLKRDVFILQEAKKQDARFNNHFPKLISKGRVVDHFKYMVMSLCDLNLDDLREKVLKSDFSISTAARLSMQSFQAVHDLHTLGYLHRNISPSKFMVGLDNSTLIYLGGFSTTYRLKPRDDKKPQLSPRKLFKMSKTRFLPRAYHRFKDFSRFDDLESWLFTAIDLFGRKILPWFDNMDESQIVTNKERFFFDAYEEIFNYVPKQLQIIKKYIDKNSEDDKPNYTFMGITLVGMRDRLKFPHTGPFDFQIGSNVPSKKTTKQAGKKATREERLPEESNTNTANAPAEGLPVYMRPKNYGLLKRSKSAKRTARKATKEEKAPPMVPEESAGGGVAVNNAMSSVKTNNKKKGHAPPPPPPSLAPTQGGDEIFEEGEGDLPQEDSGKAQLNPAQALSMARKKKETTKNAAVKAAEMDNADQGPLQPLDPGVPAVKDVKKKKPMVARSPVEEEEDDEAQPQQQQKAVQPPVVLKAKSKPKKDAAKNAKKNPTTVKASAEQVAAGGGEEEEKEEGNDAAGNMEENAFDL